MTDYLRDHLLPDEASDFLDPAGHFEGKKDGSTTTSTPQLPPALQALLGQTAGRLGVMQNQLWQRMMPGIGNVPPNWPEDWRNFGDATALEEGYDGGGNENDDGGGGSGGGGGDGGGRDTDGRIIHHKSLLDQLFGGGSATAEGGLPAEFLGKAEDAGTDGGAMDNGGMLSVRDLIDRFRQQVDPNPAIDGETGDAPPSDWINFLNWDPSEEGILGDNSRGVVGSNPLLDEAVRQIWGLQDEPPELAAARGLVGRQQIAPEELGAARGLLDEMRGVSQRQADGAGLQEDPAYLASMQAFEQAMRPMIENQAALSGLGRSTALTNATASQQAQTLLPMVQDYIGRQERSIDRELGTMGQQVQGLFGLGDRSYGRTTDTIGNLMQLGDRSYGRQLDQIGQLGAMGDYGRQIAQDRSDAQYDDWLRRAGMFEQALGGPTGLFGSSIGGQTQADKSK